MDRVEFVVVVCLTGFIWFSFHSVFCGVFLKERENIKLTVWGSRGSLGGVEGGKGL